MIIKVYQSLINFFGAERIMMQIIDTSVNFLTNCGQNHMTTIKSMDINHQREGFCHLREGYFVI